MTQILILLMHIIRGLPAGHAARDFVLPIMGGQHKLYEVEISGEPLDDSVIISDAAGRIRGKKRLFIDRFEQSRLDLTQMLLGAEGGIVNRR